MKLNVRDKKYHILIHQHKDHLPILCLLHGFMGSGCVFEHLLEPLSKFSNPVTIDLLGHGDTEGDDQDERFHMEEQVKDLSIIIQNFHDSVFLHGYSMGGRLALGYALNYPASIKGLSLESTSYGIEDTEERIRRRQLDDQRAKAIDKNFRRFLESWAAIPLFNHKIKLPAYLSKQYIAIQQAQDPAQMIHSLRGFGSGTCPSVKKFLDKLKLPTLFIAGETDIKYVSLAREMNEILPASRLAIASQAGHRVHLDHPDEWISIIESFITKHFSL